MAKKEKSWLDWLVFIFVIVGAINWGLVAFNFNLVEIIFGSISWLLTLVYVLVGLAGIYLIFYIFK